MNPKYKSKFFEFLNGELKISGLETWLYSTPELENDLDKELYFELISFNYKDKNSQGQLTELILDRTVTEGEFLTWKIKRLLKRFIETPAETKTLLDQFYNLSTDAYNSRREVSPGFKFLRHLGFNYLYWMEEDYLWSNYGKQWQIEYKKCLAELPYYHAQLEPIAKQILTALEEKQIEINGHGNYTITKTLKTELESDDVFQLEHKPHIIP